MAAGEYAVGAAARAVVADLGASVASLLRRAGLPADALEREGLAPPDYYRLWDALVEDVGPDLVARLARVLRVEVFDPAVYAALCSADLAAAAGRIAVHKRLLGPLTLDVEDDPETGLTLRIGWPPGPTPPAALVHAELAFWVVLARAGTRTALRPLRLTCPEPPTSADLLEFLGAPVLASPATTLVFTRRDAHRPFVTADDTVWQALAPLLGRRLEEHDGGTVAERVRTVLLELLPAGAASASAVARRLGLGPRTLQRRLAAEGTGFQRVLDETRSRLAGHYLDAGLPVAEIAFLLGYDEPTSFYRAFRAWSGSTPMAARRPGAGSRALAGAGG